MPLLRRYIVQHEHVARQFRSLPRYTLHSYKRYSYTRFINVVYAVYAYALLFKVHKLTKNTAGRIWVLFIGIHRVVPRAQRCAPGTTLCLRCAQGTLCPPPLLTPFSEAGIVHTVVGGTCPVWAPHFHPTAKLPGVTAKLWRLARRVTENDSAIKKWQHQTWHECATALSKSFKRGLHCFLLQSVRRSI